MEEQWKPIPSYEEFYEVSNLGRVRSVVCPRWRKPRSKPKVIVPQNFRGYERVGLFGYKGRRRWIMVHRIVAECFIGPRRRGHVVNHIDGVKHNNSVSNLEYVTHAANSKHAVALGLLPGGKNRKNDSQFNRLVAEWSTAHEDVRTQFLAYVNSAT